MTGRGRNLFKLVSMLLVAVSLYCAFGTLKSGELRFWISLCITSLIGISYLLLFLQNENEYAEMKRKAEAPPPPDDNSTVSRFFMNNCPAPAIVCDETGKVLKKTKGASEIFPELREGESLSGAAAFDPAVFSAGQNGDITEFRWEHYTVQTFTAVNTEESGKHFILLCFKDIGESESLKEEAADSRNYVALLLIDEYDELFSYEKDSKRSEVIVQIDRIAEKFIEKHNGLLKKLSDDKYFAVISEKELKNLEEKDYLAFLEEMHNIHVSERTHVSLSMGIGRGGSSLRESEEIARNALSVSQKQGGDHVVIKTGRDETSYISYGGAATKTEVNSQSKVKLFSDNLRSHMENADRAVIMGHSFSDMDAVGAASGLGGALRALGFEAYVYVNRETTLALSLVERLYANLKAEASELFISEDKALELMTEETLLIIVDTNNQPNVDSKRIYSNASKVIYIDHHIQGTKPIDNFIDRYHDPDASSASEIVAEIIRYTGLKKKLSCYYADALLAGIMLDTKDFIMKTGVRTYEAAAYLKDLGADPVSVKLLFANSFEIDKLRSRLIATAENYKNYAITCLDRETFAEYTRLSDEDIESSRKALIAKGTGLSEEELEAEARKDAADKKIKNIKVAAAQAADQLLNTLNIKASFAVFMINESSVSISARSYGTVSGGANVQDIMKRVGGGGHITMAAAGFNGKSLEEVCEMLRNAIEAYDSAMKSI
jgi:c-di-AMP phosphodiesterase-like protein